MYSLSMRESRFPRDTAPAVSRTSTTLPRRSPRHPLPRGTCPGVVTHQRDAPATLPAPPPSKGDLPRRCHAPARRSRVAFLTHTHRKRLCFSAWISLNTHCSGGRCNEGNLYQKSARNTWMSRPKDLLTEIAKYAILGAGNGVIMRANRCNDGRGKSCGTGVLR